MLPDLIVDERDDNGKAQVNTAKLMMLDVVKECEFRNKDEGIGSNINMDHYSKFVFSTSERTSQLM